MLSNALPHEMQVIKTQSLLAHLQGSSQGPPSGNLLEQTGLVLGLWALLSLVFKNICGI